MRPDTSMLKGFALGHIDRKNVLRTGANLVHGDMVKTLSEEFCDLPVPHLW